MALGAGCWKTKTRPERPSVCIPIQPSRWGFSPFTGCVDQPVDCTWKWQSVCPQFMFVSHPCRQLQQLFFILHFFLFYFLSKQIFSSVLASLIPCLFFSSWNNKSCFEAVALQKWDTDIQYILCKWMFFICICLHLIRFELATLETWRVCCLQFLKKRRPHTSLGLWGGMKLSSPRAVSPKNEGARQDREKTKEGMEREPENYQWTDFPALWPCSRLNGTPFHNGPFTPEIKEQVSRDGMPGQWVAWVQTIIMYTHGSP